MGNKQRLSETQHGKNVAGLTNSFAVDNNSLGAGSGSKERQSRYERPSRSPSRHSETRKGRMLPEYHQTVGRKKGNKV